MGLRVEQEMTHRAVTVAPDEYLYHAFAVMRRCGFRHLPVVEAGQLVGILSDRDIFKYSHMRGGALTVDNVMVRDAMTKDVYTCRRGDRLGDVIDTMLLHKIGALPVVDADGAVIGILTSTDLLSELRRHEGVLVADLGSPLNPAP
jgi:acetoin utilization protein AcuB